MLEREPDHAPARTLLAEPQDASYEAPLPALPPEPEIEPDIMADPDRPPPTLAPSTTRFARAPAPQESGAHLGDDDDAAFANTAPPSRAAPLSLDPALAATSPPSRAVHEDPGGPACVAVPI